jgi:hypothetical protein
VLSSFGIVLPCREAEALLAEAQEKKQQKAAGGVGTTIVLEKKKRRGGAASTGATKHPKVQESLLGMAPLQSKGDFVDDAGEEEHHEESPPRPTSVATIPIAVRRAPALEYNAMAAESDEDEGRTASPN